MVHQMSRQITRALVDNDIIEFDEVSVYQYGLEVMLITILELLGLLVIAFVTGYIYEALVFILAFSSVRLYAGGYHASSVFKCFSLIVLLVFIDINICRLLVIESAPWLSVVISAIAFGIIYKNAPVAVVNRPITENERVKFRKISINLSLSYFIGVIAIAITNQYTWYLGIFSVGFLLEAITLLVERYRKETVK